MATLLSLAFFAAVLRITIPYALAATGGAISERSGVINLALEGMLLSSALGATLGAHFGHGALAGVMCGIATGAAIAAIYALLTVYCGADQIVCGVAINLLADGATRFVLKAVFDSSSNSPRVDAWGPERKWLWVLGAIVVVALAQLLLARTRLGLRIRAVGEHPEAAATVGVSVTRVRFIAVVLGGAVAGLGGAWLAYDQHQFVAGMSNGRGYIALAAIIFGAWRPLYAAASCVLFGAAEAVQITLQAQGGGVPGWLLQMLPYVITIAVLAGFIGRRRPPSALGKPAQ